MGLEITDYLPILQVCLSIIMILGPTQYIKSNTFHKNLPALNLTLAVSCQLLLLLSFLYIASFEYEFSRQLIIFSATEEIHRTEIFGTMCRKTIR